MQLFPNFKSKIMSTKKHVGHPLLTGEHKYGDKGQLILFFLFLGIWITDFFVFHYSTFLLEIIPEYAFHRFSRILAIDHWLLYLHLQI